MEELGNERALASERKPIQKSVINMTSGILLIVIPYFVMLML